jgi:hypothetical protein
MRDLAEQNSQDAAHQHSAHGVHQSLVEYLSQRPDWGLDKMLLNMALEPASPFDPKGRRNFRKGFVLLLLVASGLAATFVYFNLLAAGQ